MQITMLHSMVRRLRCVCRDFDNGLGVLFQGLQNTADLAASFNSEALDPYSAGRVFLLPRRIKLLSLCHDLHCDNIELSGSYAILLSICKWVGPADGPVSGHIVWCDRVCNMLSFQLLCRLCRRPRGSRSCLCIGGERWYPLFRT